MKLLAEISKGIGKLLDCLVGVVIAVVILFSSYSLYSSYLLYKGAFVSKKLTAVKPETDKENGRLSFDALKKINSDVVAWISVDQTHIDYPVVQGKTNLDYINQNIYKKFALEGTIFLDSRNTSNFTDFYNILYGHHMENGAMFGDLQKFLKKDFFDCSRTGELRVPSGKYRIDLFAVIQVDGYDSVIFQPDGMTTEKKREQLISYIKSKQVHYRKIKMKSEDRLIGFSTCASTQTNGRTIVYGCIRQIGKGGNSETIP